MDEPTAPGMPGPVDVGSELGSTKNPAKIVPGQVDEIADSATDSSRIGVAARNAGDGLTKLTTGGWQGAAADKFREHFKGVPARWQLLGEAMVEAAKALAPHAETLQNARHKAQQAIDMWDDAKRLSLEHAKAVNAYNDRVDDYNDGDGPHPGPQPGPDPGDAKRAEAQRLVDEGRAAVKASGDAAAATFRTWAARLPDIPGMGDRLLMSAEDSTQFFVDQVVDSHKGMYSGAFEMWKTGMEKSPLTPGNLLNPAEYATHMAELAGNIVTAAANPVATVEHIASTTWQKWSTGSIAYNVGELLPGMAAGMGAGYVMKGVKVLDGLSELGKTLNKTPDAGDSRSPNTHSANTQQSPGWQHPFAQFDTTNTSPRGTWDVITDAVEDSFGPIKNVVDDVVTDLKAGFDTPTAPHHTNQPPPPRYDDVDDGWRGLDQPRAETSTPNTTPQAHHNEPQQPHPDVNRPEQPTPAHRAESDPTPQHDTHTPEPEHRDPGEPKDHHNEDNPRQPDHDDQPPTRDPEQHPVAAHDPAVRADVEHSAAIKDIDLSKMPEDAVWRTDSDPLYRVGAGRGLDFLFENGLEPKNQDLSNLRDFVSHNVDSGWTSTTRDSDLWQTHDIGLQGKDTFYVLEIDARGGVDVDRSIGNYFNESEVAFPGGLDPARIKGGFYVRINPDGSREKIPDSWVDNPNYEPDGG